MKPRPSFARVSRIAGILLLVAAAQSVRAAELDFRRDIQPILSNHCWTCHGPDEKARKAKLRLDTAAFATAARKDGSRAIVPGKPGESALAAHIDSNDPDEIMPPPGFKKPLTAQQKEMLRQWIAQGAPYAKHWAFEAPQRPAVPVVKNAAFPVRNAIDAFVAARLDKDGINASPEAEKSVWLRRVSLDLTGLPPTLEERSVFLADASADAYEKVVDRLLASPRYAERMALHWLDGARYADTNGYNNDELRTLWPWRDWVISAFSRNLPYDQFLTEQLAGDLLPNASVAQRVATGFIRNHVLTTEGGIIEEEYRAEYVADRIHTFATVCLAMSFQCARCHDHKYDPILQKDYYRFSAFFNTVPDRVVGYGAGVRMAEPVLKAPSIEQQTALDVLEKRRVEIDSALRERVKSSDADALKWEQALKPEELEKAGPAGLVAHFPLDEITGNETPSDANNLRGKITGKLVRTQGKIGGALEFDGKSSIAAGNTGDFEADQAFTLSAWVRPTSKEPTTVLSKMDDANANRGYDIILEGGKVASHFVHHFPDKAFKVVSNEPISLNEWHHIAVAYTGSRDAKGLTLYVDGKPRAVDVTTNNKVDGTLKTDKSFHIGQRGSSAFFKGAIDDVQIFAGALKATELAQLAAGQPLSGLKDLLVIASEKRSDEQRTQIRNYFLERVDPIARKLRAELDEVARKKAEVENAIPATMVMADVAHPKAFVLMRGQYDKKGEEVTAGVPAVFSEFPKDAPLNRLGLARWLTSPSHPLTARVAVNRWWEMLFGTGIVETSEDFGIQGAQPSHPELLDWLATELIRTNWDTRTMLKLMVLSATYRQSSRITPELLEKDPRNRLLARGPRFRLPAETIRDQALFVSGLLKEKIGGPSVKPYQPDGLWEDVSVERRDKYKADEGDGLYRRSMYTFWKRTCSPPGMNLFDAPDRETCVVRRARTNTPLQALALLNDPTYVEAARKLAERALAAGTSEAERVAFLCRVTLSRDPSPDESRVLLDVQHAALERFKNDESAAGKLLKVGHSPVDSKAAPAELAAWTAAASVLLNLDEAISKP